MRSLFTNWDERNKFIAKRFIIRKRYMQVIRLKERDDKFDKAMTGVLLVNLCLSFSAISLNLSQFLNLDLTWNNNELLTYISYLSAKFLQFFLALAILYLFSIYLATLFLKRYELLNKQGKSAYGIVFKARDKKTHEIVALKKCFDAFQNATDYQRTYIEIIMIIVLRIILIKNKIIENLKELYKDNSSDYMTTKNY